MLRVTSYPAFAERVAARRGANDFAPPLKPPNAAEVWAAFESNVIDHPSFTASSTVISGGSVQHFPHAVH